MSVAPLATSEPLKLAGGVASILSRKLDEGSGVAVGVAVGGGEVGVGVAVGEPVDFCTST